VHVRADEHGDLLPGVSKFWALRPWTDMDVVARVNFLRIFVAFMHNNHCPHVSCWSVKTAATAVMRGGHDDEVVTKMLFEAIGVKRRKRGSVGASESSNAIVGMKRGLQQWEELEVQESTQDDDEKVSDGEMSSDNSENDDVVKRPKKKSSTALTRKPAKKQKKGKVALTSIFGVVLNYYLYVDLKKNGGKTPVRLKAGR
jgi:hypothetical protein